MGIKYIVDSTFFNVWSSKMSYVLGYLYADGSLEDASYLRGKYVRVSSIDQITIQNIKNLLGSMHTITKVVSHQGKRQNKYLLRIGDHILYNALVKRGLFPKKSLSMQLPLIPKKYIKDFVRGYFDGDGCIYIERHNFEGSQKIKRLRLIFTSGSRIFLEQLLQLLKSYIGLESGKIYKSHRSFQLCYGTDDAVKLFKLFYKDVSSCLYLHRKAEIFLDYFKVRSARVDKTVRSIVNYLNK